MTGEAWEPDSEHRYADAEAVGSAAEEAARLFTAMRDRVLSDPTAMRAGLKIMETFASLSTSGGTPVPPGGAPECAYCPVCQAMRRAQSISPEAVERLTGAAMEFAETVRKVVGQPGTTDPDGDGVRHVPLDEDFEGWPEPIDLEDEGSGSRAAGEQTGQRDPDAQ